MATPKADSQSVQKPAVRRGFIYVLCGFGFAFFLLMVILAVAVGSITRLAV